MEYIYTPVGFCYNQFLITMDGDIITSVKIRGGCPGNTLAVTTLVEGNNIHDVIKKLKGIPCGVKGTSCPDQLAIALEQILENRN